MEQHAIRDPWSMSQRILFAGHLAAATASALVAIGTALRLSEEGRLHTARLQIPEPHADSATASSRGSARDYFNI